ncbi:35592_t:CDS:2 [Racocetra persica]|uniref:35592_t:CDS:1 n=1 Tax=Racocetra persica TaxID=160502 RepID=A0ACA9LQD6_9GLOM|nr:35592_t:CDS:2 [Racocetra persica]
MNGHNESRVNIPFIYYDEFQDIRLLDEGGFGEIFQATWITALGKEIKYAEGGNLLDNLSKSYKDILWKERLARLQSIIIGLLQIHERGLIHRDLHSKNILICKNGDKEFIKIGDLGLATLEIDQLCKIVESKEIDDRKNEFHNADEIIRNMSDIEYSNYNSSSSTPNLSKSSYCFEILKPEELID